MWSTMPRRGRDGCHTPPPDQLALLGDDDYGPVPLIPADDTPAEWIRGVVDVIVVMAPTRRTTAADDVRAMVSPPRDPRWWGLARAAHDRIIIPAGGHRRSVTRSRRHGSVAVWRGRGPA